MIYGLLVALIAGASMGAGGMAWWNDAAEARHTAALAAAQADIDAKVAKITTDAANYEIDMTAQFNAGEAKGRAASKTIYEKGVQYAATTPVFALPECRVPPTGVQLLAGARSGVLTAADIAGIDAAMLGTGSTEAGQRGREPVVQGAVPAQPARSGAVAGVPQQQSGARAGGAVPAQSTRGHPKPRPIQ